MMESPKFVHAFVLRMPEKEEEKIKSQIGDFYSRPANLRKKVILHLSLFVVYLDEEKIKQMLDFLSVWKPDFKAVVGTLGELEKVGENYIGFAIQSIEIQPMHETLTESIKHITAGCFDARYLKEKLTEKQRSYLDNYGYHRIKEYFQPHITIGKYVDQDTRDREFACAPKLEGKITFTHLVFDQSIVNSGIPAEVLWSMSLV